MNPLQKTLLSAIKAVLWDAHFEYEEGVTAEELFSEACRYEIAGVLSVKLDTFCGTDTAVRAKWSGKAMADYQKSYAVLEAQSALCRVLSAENIRPVFLKGISSAYYYPVPLLRQIGDIDFIVPPEQFDACCRLMEQNGYERGADDTRHIEYYRQGMEYECHRFFSHNVTDADRTVDRKLYVKCRNCITRSLEGREYYTLSDAEYGIVLLEHLKHHLVDGVGFRQIMDWTVYADSVMNDEFWNAGFQKLVRESGLERLAAAVTRTSQMYLGLRTDGSSWCSDMEESVCGELIEMIFSCNNFGFIGEEDRKAFNAGYIARHGIVSQFNSRALLNMPAAEKIVVLRPAAWVYQALRWGVKGTAYLSHRDRHTDMSREKLRKHREFLKRIGVQA